MAHPVAASSLNPVKEEYYNKIEKEHLRSEEFPSRDENCRDWTLAHALFTPKFVLLNQKTHSFVLAFNNHTFVRDFTTQSSSRPQQGTRTSLVA